LGRIGEGSVSFQFIEERAEGHLYRPGSLFSPVSLIR
jgi:hypothetical protein